MQTAPNHGAPTSLLKPLNLRSKFGAELGSKPHMGSKVSFYVDRNEVHCMVWSSLPSTSEKYSNQDPWVSVCVPWWPVSTQDSSSKKEVFLNAPFVGANLEKREECRMLCWFVLLAEPCWGQVLPAASCGFVAGQAEGCAAGLVLTGGAAARLLRPDNTAEVKGAYLCWTLWKELLKEPLVF